jgi:hypothetical protein
VQALTFRRSGSGYAAESLAILRWLIAAGAISAMNHVPGTILYLAKKTFTLVAINCVDAIIVIGLTLTVAHSARDVAICWCVGEISNTALFGLCAARSVRQVHGRWEALGAEGTRG